MEPRPSQNAFDPDLDTPPRLMPRLSSESIEDQLRLIVNPFLAVLGWVIALVIIRVGPAKTNPYLFLTGLGLLWVPLFLFQYHCLDCGKTELVTRVLEGIAALRWRHARESGTVRRFPGD